MKKSKIIKIIVSVLSLILLSLLVALLLIALEVLYYDDGFKLNIELFLSLTQSWYGIVLILLIEVLITSLLAFIPGTSMAFILLWQTIFDKPFIAFLLAFVGVMLSSLTMYLMGKLGGYKICTKILGEEDCQKATKLLNGKGKIYFPIMMLFPVFPDDALVMIAGTLKMDLKWFIPSIIIGRGVGIATIIFGISIIPFEKFTTIWHWIIFIIIVAILVITVFVLANKLNSYLEKRNSKKE